MTGSQASASTPREVWREEPVRGGYPDPGLLGLPGRERLELWRRGQAPPPPLYHLTGARPTGFSDGTADAEMPASGWLANSAGLISGGTLAIAADIAFGCAVETQLPPATPYTTAELSLTFLRPARPGGMLSAHGQAIHVGRSVGLCEAFVFDSGGERLIAHGTSRLSIRPPLDPPPDPPEDPEDWAGTQQPDHPTPDPYRRPAPDGVLPADAWSDLSGIEVLERQARGELPPPPVHFLTGIEPKALGEGTAAMRMPCSEWLASPTRTVQGGVTAMLADHAMLTAVQSTAPAGSAFAGLDLKVNYLRPVLPDGRDLLARASVEHRGRTIAVMRAVVENADGKRVALATGSAMFLTERPPSLDELELGSAQ